MTRTGVLRLLFAGALCATSVHAQSPAAGTKSIIVRSMNVRDMLYLLVDPEANTLALADEDAELTVLMDTRAAGWGRATMDGVSRVTELPLKFVINLDADDDSAGSNSELGTGIEFVAQENTRVNLAKKDAFKGDNARYLPGRTFTDRLNLLEGHNRIELYYFGPAHTNGDAIVVMPDKGVAFLGDLFPAKATPIIDRANGGSGVHFAETLNKAVAGIKGITRVVPGHSPAPGGRSAAIGPVHEWFTWNDLQEYADFNREFLAAVRRSFDAGKTVDEAAAALSLPEKYKNYGMQNARANVQAIYEELKTQR